MHLSTVSSWCCCFKTLWNFLEIGAWREGAERGEGTSLFRSLSSLPSPSLLPVCGCNVSRCLELLLLCLPCHGRPHASKLSAETQPFVLSIALGQVTVIRKVTTVGLRHEPLSFQCQNGLQSVPKVEHR